MTYLHFNAERQTVEPCDAPTPEACPLGLWTAHGANTASVREAYRAWLRDGEGIIKRFYSKTKLHGNLEGAGE